MPPDPSPLPARAWTAVERGLLVALLIGAAVLGGIWWLRGGSWRPAAMTSTAGEPGPYANKLDPNTAPWQALACLPGVGEQRAKDIVAYRDRHGGPGPAFTQPADLANVRNIKGKTVERIAPFLAFPTAGPASAPND